MSLIFFSSPGGTYGMDKMKQKDAEERLKRMDTKQRRGSPTVSFFFFLLFFLKFQFLIEIEILISIAKFPTLINLFYSHQTHQLYS